MCWSADKLYPSWCENPELVPVAVREAEQTWPWPGGGCEEGRRGQGEELNAELNTTANRGMCCRSPSGPRVTGVAVCGPVLRGSDE